MRSTGLSITTFALFALLLSIHSAGAQKLSASTTIGTNPAGTAFYAVAAGLAKVISTTGSMQSTVQPYSGSSTFLPLLDSGELDFGIINAVEKSPYWKDTAIIIAYDDSDGWYDHVMPPILKGSAIPGIDALNGDGKCGTQAAGAYPGRCGYGPRLPLLVVSPYARVNFVDHSLTDQTSILRFIEDNWDLGRLGDQSYDELAGPLDQMFDFDKGSAMPVMLDPKTGAL